jgi:hypothetical protein
MALVLRSWGFNRLKPGTKHDDEDAKRMALPKQLSVWWFAFAVDRKLMANTA